MEIGSLVNRRRLKSRARLRTGRLSLAEMRDGAQLARPRYPHQVVNGSGYSDFLRELKSNEVDESFPTKHANATRTAAAVIPLS
jgi:hypothetical protein